MCIYRYKYVLLVVVLACGIPGSAFAQHSQGGKISVPKVLLGVFQTHIAAQEAALKAKENQARTQLELCREIGKFLHTGPSEKINRTIATALGQVLKRDQDVLFPSLTGDSAVYILAKVSLEEVSRFEKAAASHLKDVQAKLNAQPVVVPVDYGPTVGED